MQATEGKEMVGSTDSFISTLSDHYNSPDLSDVVLQVGDISYYAHKFLLANLSDVMRTMLTESRWEDSKKDTVKLEETPECAAVFGDFLKFMYTGQVELRVSDTLPILALADKYNVALLKSVCEDYMARQVIQSRNLKGALQWWGHAACHNLTHLEPECRELIEENLNEVVKTPEWLNLSVDQICSILRSSNVVIKDEYTLYRCVVCWLQSADHEANISEYLDCVLPILRFCRMMPEQLDAIEHSLLYRQHPNKFTPYFYGAYKFLAMGRKVAAAGNPMSSYQSREYGHSPCPEPEITLSIDNIQQRFLGYQHSIPMYPKSFANGISLQPQPRRLNVDVCRMRNGHLWGLYLRLLPMEQGTYSLRVRLSDSKTGKILSVIRRYGQVGEKIPHIAYVDVEDDPYSDALDDMFTIPASQQNPHNLAQCRQNTCTIPILCAFTGIKVHPASVTFTIRVIFLDAMCRL
ncbi:BTB/POZ domain-containing protein 19-like [Ptychodera flava]|uniref:BTB/POZ domain-containing protein 19-like n=1 Tax=Ptychodera flava TaxID=63121 RepID=UPI003969EB5B